MLQRFLGFLIISLVSTAAFATDDDGNTAKIKGQVISSKNQPIAYVNIALEGANKGIYTDFDGSFMMSNLQPGIYTLRVSSIGFISLVQEISVRAGQQLELTLTMEEDTYAMPEVTIIGQKERLFSSTPGAVSFVGPKELNLFRPLSGNEILKKVPGLHVVDEEGAGMRVNIGVRGLDPDRSRSVLILEDGVPVALAPYGEPEMYYTPVIDRMQGVEVLKGSGQILYGPQTIGGVINYITANPPEQAEGSLRLRGGQNGYFSGLLNFGTSFDGGGFSVQYLRKQAQNMGPTWFTINDFTTKFRLKLAENSNVMLKLGIYDEYSNSTYIGLTQTMYDAGNLDFVQIAPEDRLEVKRYSASIIHEHYFSPNIKLSTTAFAYTTTRDWKRQDFQTGGNRPANATGVIWGDTTVAGGYLYMRKTAGHRNRQFAVAGIEPRLNYQFNLFGFENELNLGARLLHERAFEQLVNGSDFRTNSGALIEDEERPGQAYSTYFQYKIKPVSNLSIHAGARMERYDYQREIFRRRFNGVVMDTSLVAGSSVAEIIPGAGFAYTLQSNMVVFGGLHKGFAPPRIKDVISGNGEAMSLDAESSWNYELGIRTFPGKGIFLELNSFYMDFSNQIIPVSESAGGTGSGLVNGGATLHRGIETALGLEFGKIFNWNFALNLDLNATIQKSTFSADRFINVENTSVNIAGNLTPYAPQLIYNAALALELSNGFGLVISGNYSGAQFGDELNTVIPSANGRIGKIDAYYIMDATAQYQLPIKALDMSVNVSAKNLTNERYIVSRRPQGIRVGLDRMIMAGIDLRF